jgi:hypothetical protein
MPRVKFQTGQIVTTKAIKELINFDQNLIVRISEFLERHYNGDWGILSAEDKAQNDAAVLRGGRILSQYQTDYAKIWVITEADRATTTILLPSEY